MQVHLRDELPAITAEVLEADFYALAIGGREGITFYGTADQLRALLETSNEALYGAEREAEEEDNT